MPSDQNSSGWVSDTVRWLTEHDVMDGSGLHLEPWQIQWLSLYYSSRSLRDSHGPGPGEELDMPHVELNDSVNHPAHYNTYKGLEVIDLVEQMNFNRGNAVKYIARAGHKSPETTVEDLKKARWYIDREIARLEGDNASV